jgi:hypothetical protein
MQKARIVAIMAAALVAVTASAVAAWWVTSRSRRLAETAPKHGTAATTGEIEIEIPPAAGPTSAAQLDTIAPLDPGKLADSGASSEAAEPAPSEPAPPRRRR